MLALRVLSALTFACLLAPSVSSAKSIFKPGTGPAPIDIQAEIVGMQGLGCPSGGASAVFSPDGSSVSILFDKMSTELPPISAEKKQCMVRLGFRFSGKYRVAVVGSDARGFVSVPEGGTSTLSVQHYSIFTVNPKHLARMNLTRTFVGPRTEEVLLHSDFRDIPMWSYCGSQMPPRGAAMQIMTINLTIDSSNQSPSETLLASVDSLDIGGPATLTYQLLWTYDKKNCP
ncbi:MAG: DUF4360 domain-containing protein [Proteobacteria bacterium]|nr:MAG: DUF4360 domain-containing protein [Pseudomonadota bacterium]